MRNLLRVVILIFTVAGMIRFLFFSVTKCKSEGFLLSGYDLSYSEIMAFAGICAFALLIVFVGVWLICLSFPSDENEEQRNSNIYKFK